MSTKRTKGTAAGGSVRTITFGTVAAFVVGWVSVHVDHLSRDQKAIAVVALTGAINYVWSKAEERWPSLAWLRPTPEQKPRDGERGRRIVDAVRRRSGHRNQTPDQAPPVRLADDSIQALAAALAEQLKPKRTTTRKG